jgi:hypothetical protein
MLLEFLSSNNVNLLTVRNGVNLLRTTSTILEYTTMNPNKCSNGDDDKD